MSHLTSVASPPQEREVQPFGLRNWWPTTLLIALILLVYGSVLGRLTAQWWQDPNFSHGFFVPVFALFLVWEQRWHLVTLPCEPSWAGLFVIAGSLAMLVVGVLGAELFLSRSSLVFLASGLILLFHGWPRFRALFFPWAVLFLMIPIPTILFGQITFPLQMIASQLASSVLAVIGVPVLREGNVIKIPAMSLEIAQACSGIRSLLSLGTLAVIYGYFAEKNSVARVLIALSALPIAVLANAMRIVGTGLLVQYWDPDKGEGFFHTFSGWIIFVFALLMLYLLHKIARRLRPSLCRGSRS
jgi:exosortase